MMNRNVVDITVPSSVPVAANRRWKSRNVAAKAGSCQRSTPGSRRTNSSSTATNSAGGGRCQNETSGPNSSTYDGR